GPAVAPPGRGGGKENRGVASRPGTRRLELPFVELRILRPTGETSNTVAHAGSLAAQKAWIALRMLQQQQSAVAKEVPPRFLDESPLSKQNLDSRNQALAASLKGDAAELAAKLDQRMTTPGLRGQKGALTPVAKKITESVAGLMREVAGGPWGRAGTLSKRSRPSPPSASPGSRGGATVARSAAPPTPSAKTLPSSATETPAPAPVATAAASAAAAVGAGVVAKALPVGGRSASPPQAPARTRATTAVDGAAVPSVPAGSGIMAAPGVSGPPVRGNRNATEAVPAAAAAGAVARPPRFADEAEAAGGEGDSGGAGVGENGARGDGLCNPRCLDELLDGLVEYRDDDGRPILYFNDNIDSFKAAAGGGDIRLQDEWDEREMANLRQAGSRQAEAQATAEIRLWGCETDAAGAPAGAASSSAGHVGRAAATTGGGAA
ncbi:unnamed protein product, partial [Ectocarpus fasciculatus]